MTFLTLTGDERRVLAIHTDADGRVRAQGEISTPAPGAEPALLRHALSSCAEPPAAVLVAIPWQFPSAAPVQPQLETREPPPERPASPMLRALLAEVPPGTRLYAASPAEAIAAGALGQSPGIVIECSLRAAAHAITDDGRFRSSHAGHTLVGDEGSALWLVSHALRLAMLGEGARMPRSERLERSFTGYFGADSIAEIMERIDALKITRGELSGFVSVILHLAEYPEPDPGCRVLVLQASRALARLAASLDPQEGTRVTWHGDGMHGPLLAATRDELKSLAWTTPKRSMEDGALLLARASRALDAPSGNLPDGVWRP